MSLYIRGDFHVCPNPLCGDPYSICEWDCRYCWIKDMEKGILRQKAEKGLKPYGTESLKKYLQRAFDSKQETKNPVVLALRAGLPVLVGRKCDPLCPSESRYRATLSMLEELKRYDVPTIMETKGVTNERCYFDNLSGVLVSLTPGTEDLHDRLEPGTPQYHERVGFAKALKDAGLWVGFVAEPIIPSVNDKQEYFEEYAKIAERLEVDHICFGGYRIHNPRLAYSRMRDAGFDLVEILKAKTKGWEDTGTRFFASMRKHGLKASSPDWDLFYFSNSTYSCCGLDGFGTHKFTFQWACEILREKARLQWQEVARHNILGEKAKDRFREIWNGKQGYYNLTDVKGIHKIGYDEDGNIIYGRRGLSDTFA